MTLTADERAWVAKRYRMTHGEAEAARVRQWRVEHADQVRATQQAHRDAHRAENVARMKQWRKENPEKMAEQQRRARARKRKVQSVSCGDDAPPVAGERAGRG